jgi:indolepyruvate ferredoxin oxidoreductase beta subunit
VYSPLTPAGEVDILLALEKLEGLRYAHYVRDGGLIVLNNEQRVPAPLDSTSVDYPRDVEAFLRDRGFVVYVVDATAEATVLGNSRAANTVLLGAIAVHTGISGTHWTMVMKESLSPKILDLNLSAFERGKAIAEKARVHDA